jgi:hypothetical protein
MGGAFFAQGTPAMKTHFVSLFELDGKHPDIAVHDSLQEAEAALARALKATARPDDVVNACIFQCTYDERCSDPIPVAFE